MKKMTKWRLLLLRYENLVIILQFQNVSFTILKKKILNMLIYRFWCYLFRYFLSILCETYPSPMGRLEGA